MVLKKTATTVNNDVTSPYSPVELGKFCSGLVCRANRNSATDSNKGKQIKVVFNLEGAKNKGNLEFVSSN